ncbi:hypothetical protein SAMN05216276_107818 [Streptosporangium subroseum]|uniref:PIN domain-containing protein n=1 Tax=Streptosporangium subroseum TaxID=106412 RepID=A0A239P1F5_9ACTN|nr:hypothetical protein [Streptosporangium subroseum]SNT60553.1 hypothetical protein SAMN05216276_107818 [Streptosporangium subroseum]
MIGAVLDRSAIAAWARLDQHIVAWLMRAEDASRPLLIATSELTHALAAAETLHEVETIGHLVEMGMTVPPPAGDLTPQLAFHVADVMRDAKDVDLGQAHTLILALAREWPILTAMPHLWATLSPGIVLEALPG